MITENQIHLHATAKTQEEVFSTIAEIAVQNGIATDAERVITGLKEREAQSTTGFLDGFAIPHTQAETITQPGIIVVRTEQGIDWDSFDDQPPFSLFRCLYQKKKLALPTCKRWLPYHQPDGRCEKRWFSSGTYCT